MPLTLIVAYDRTRGIGINNTLPWHLPEDLAYFKCVTSGHPIIMGRKTFDSIGRPLPNRRNIVITRNAEWAQPGVEMAASLEEAVRLGGDDAFIIGGAEIFVQALPLAQRLLVTEVHGDFHCDTFFPAIDAAQWKETTRQPQHSEKSGIDFAFVAYERQ
jgi:dihydrofolate reductase